MESAGNIAAPCCLFAALDRAAILFFFLFCGRIAVESGLYINFIVYNGYLIR
jgi:hypothetical protein